MAESIEEFKIKIFDILSDQEIQLIKSRTDIRNSYIGDITIIELDEIGDYLLRVQHPRNRRATMALDELLRRIEKTIFTT